jgi:hypothetical protein
MPNRCGTLCALSTKSWNTICLRRQQCINISATASNSGKSRTEEKDEGKIGFDRTNCNCGWEGDSRENPCTRGKYEKKAPRGTPLLQKISLRTIRASHPMFLFQKNEFLHVDKASCLQPIEVHAAAEIRGIPPTVYLPAARSSFRSDATARPRRSKMRRGYNTKGQPEEIRRAFQSVITPEYSIR